MRTYVLSQNERAQYGFTHKFVITLADLTAAAAGATAAFTLLTGKVGQVINKGAIKVKTQGAHASTLTLGLGDSNSAARYVTASDGKAAAETLYIGSTQYAMNTAYNISTTFTAGAGNANAATAGEWELWIDITDLSAATQLP
jgi:hypothetical protein